MTKPNSYNIAVDIIGDIFPRLDAGFMSETICRSVHPANWQGMSVKDKAEAEMRELLNVHLDIDLHGTYRSVWQEQLEPHVNLPWADHHFEERVCGEPINPGKEWANWPWGNSASTFLNYRGQFNHNYMERYWPKHAGQTEWGDEASKTAIYPIEDAHQGIRNEYGDLNDVVDQLHKDPHTRQAYLPIYHPEDVGEVEGGRRPCTLGYQFIMRDGHLHCYYPMRSCDYSRHFADDVYLTLRLMQWVLDELAKKEPTWKRVRVGSLQMHITSLHMFINDYNTRFKS